MPLAIEAASNTPQWYAARRGHLTSCRMIDVIAVSKRDPKKPLKARQDYMFDIVSERMTGIAVTHYVTEEMQWGLDHEEEAAAEYEQQSGNLVMPGGFVLHPSIEFFGATPDRAVGDEGLLEIKCPTTTTFIEWLLDGIVPEEHRPQMLAQLACTRRQWVDFIAFDPRIQHGPKSFIRRFEPKAGEIEAIEDAARTFLQEVDRLFTQITEGFHVK